MQKKFLCNAPMHTLPFAAIRSRIKAGYSWTDFRTDLMAGLVVGTVALPLGMALAIASGAPPQQGLYTVIVAGSVVALVGGSYFQVTGPTAAFVVILVPIIGKFGLQGLFLAELMAGILLMLMGAVKLGKYIEHVPHSVTLGFTAGIGVVIATLQLKDFFGLQVIQMPDAYIERIRALLMAAPSMSWSNLAIASATLSLLLIWPRLNKKIPAPLVVLGIVSAGTWLVQKNVPGFQPATIGNRFHFLQNGILLSGIPHQAPKFMSPWGSNTNWTQIIALFPSAVKIALLGAIESLLSAVVADHLTKTKHNPDAELLALGTGNIITPFFGGVPATGAIARTATNIQYGARSPMAAISHAVFVLLVVLLFAPLISYLPMAALAALLLLVAYNMSDVKHVIHFLRIEPHSEILIFTVSFLLTIFFDMVAGVGAGMAIYLLLHARRLFLHKTHSA